MAECYIKIFQIFSFSVLLETSELKFLKDNMMSDKKIWKKKQMLWMFLVSIIDQKLYIKINWNGTTIDSIQQLNFLKKP